MSEARMKLESVELVGQRAKLMPMEPSHLEGLFEAANCPGIWDFMPLKVNSCADMERVMSDALAARDKGSEMPFVIIDQEQDRVVGSTRFLDISLQHRNLEIGWTWLTPGVWRTSINTECKYMLLKHCFECVGTYRVQIKTDGRNLRSQAAIERIGGVKEGVLRRHRILPDGYVRDSVYYSILDSEWPTVKTRLEAMLAK